MTAFAYKQPFTFSTMRRIGRQKSAITGHSDKRVVVLFWGEVEAGHGGAPPGFVVSEGVHSTGLSWLFSAISSFQRCTA